tara:strand:+ start:2552 stop:3283 length:732 start_codon:yes stop_codon:yes gene_type:complete
MKKKILLGSWITLSHPSITEIFSNCKEIDYLVIDLEHSVISLFEVENLIRIIKLKGKLAFVRLSGIDQTEIKKVLDSGADGIIVPMIKSVADVNKVLDYSLFPPNGSRSFSLSRAYGYGANFKSYINRFEKKFKIILQIEHIDAVKNLENIINSKKIYSILVGPYDLSGSLGIPGNFTNKKYLSALKKIDEVCKKKNIVKGIHYPEFNKKKFRELVKQNYKLIAYGMDTRILDLAIKNEFKNC